MNEEQLKEHLIKSRKNILKREYKNVYLGKDKIFFAKRNFLRKYLDKVNHYYLYYIIEEKNKHNISNHLTNRFKHHENIKYVNDLILLFNGRPFNLYPTLEDYQNRFSVANLIIKYLNDDLSTLRVINNMTMNASHNISNYSEFKKDLDRRIEILQAKQDLEQSIEIHELLKKIIFKI